MKKAIQHLNYFYIFLAIIWTPLQVAILHVDAAGRILFTLTILVFILNLIYNNRFILIVKSKPVVFWLIWVAYSCINLYIKGYDEELPFIFYCVLKIFLPFVVMIVGYEEYLHNRKRVLYLLIITFLLYGLMDVFLLNRVSNIGNSGSDRSWGELRNSGPLNIVFLIFFSSLLYLQKGLKLYQLVLIISFALFEIFIGETRKALGASLIIIAFTIISQIELNPKKIILVTIIFVSLYSSYNYMINNTAIGKRIVNIEEQGEKYNTTNNKALNLLGDRAEMYILGWGVFTNNKLTGVGLRNFRVVAGYNYVLHSEYMVQLAEGGLFGSLFYLLFNIFIIKSLYNSWKMYPKRRNIIWVLTGGFVAILFINFTSWTYAFPQYFIAFGLILAQLKNLKYENRNTRYRKKLV